MEYHWNDGRRGVAPRVLLESSQECPSCGTLYCSRLKSPKQRNLLHIDTSSSLIGYKALHLFFKCFPFVHSPFPLVFIKLYSSWVVLLVRCFVPETTLSQGQIKQTSPQRFQAWMRSAVMLIGREYIQGVSYIFSIVPWQVRPGTVSAV